MDLFIIANAAGLGEAIAQAIYTIADQLLPVATALAVIGCIVCGIKLIAADDPKQVQSAKTWLISIVVGYALIILARTLVPLLGDIFQNVQTEINVGE